MDNPEIKLELDPATGQERLLGLNGELVPDSRILLAVAANRRLFPHVVKRLAVNQYITENPSYIHIEHEAPDAKILDLMRDVRDLLVDGIARCADISEMVE